MPLLLKGIDCVVLQTNSQGGDGYCLGFSLVSFGLVGACMCVCVYVRAHTHAMAYMGRLGVNFVELILSFHLSVGSTLAQQAPLPEEPSLQPLLCLSFRRLCSLPYNCRVIDVNQPAPQIL